MSQELNKEKFKEKVAALKKRAEEDSVFDRRLLNDYHFRNTQNMIWWIQQKMEWNQMLAKIDSNRRAKYREVYEYYKKDFHLTLKTKEDYEAFILSDPNYISAHDNYVAVKNVITFIDSIIDALKSLSFEVKNAIQWELFKNGR